MRLTRINCVGFRAPVGVIVTLMSPLGGKGVVKSGLETLSATCALRVVVVDIEVLFRAKITEPLGGLVVEATAARVAL